MRKLTNITIKKAADGKLQDGGGLLLNKVGDGGRWIYRYSRNKRRREMGLGSWPVVTLAEARRQRDAWAAVLAGGQDPIDVRNAERQAEIDSQSRTDPTFAELADMVFEAKKATLRGEGTRGRWRSPIDQHVIPVVGKKHGSELTQRDIHDALKPIWQKKHPTAIKALRRIRLILKSARLMGFPVDPLIADAAQEMLGQVRHREVNTPSVPWQDIPELYQALGDGIGARCNKWMILTLVRMDGCIGARISEVDMRNQVWTVPADRIKGREGQTEAFRVPLSQPAIEMVQFMKPFGLDLLFPGQRDTDKPITNVGVEKALKALDAPGTPHGFRTSFRTWVQDTQVCAFEVAETVLNHVVGTKVERSYARSDLLDQRRIVMDAWARFVTGQDAKIIPISSSHR